MANDWQALAEQLRAQGGDADWNIGGIDRADELAQMLWGRGVRDLSQMRLADKAYDYDVRQDRGWDFGGDNPIEQRQGQALDFGGGLLLGGLGDQGKGDRMGDQYGVLSADQYGKPELGWSSQGHGAVGYQVRTGADGKPQIVPAWNSSSDADDVRGLGMVFGGALAGSMGAFGAGAEAAGGAGASAAAPEAAASTVAGGAGEAGLSSAAGGGLKTTSLLGSGGGASAIGGSGLTTTGAMSAAMTPTISAGGSTFSLGSLFSGFTGKDWIGVLGAGVQYAEGRRRERAANERSDTQRAQDRQWQLDDRADSRTYNEAQRDEQRAYNERLQRERWQRMGSTGGGLLGVRLKRKGA